MDHNGWIPDAHSQCLEAHGSCTLDGEAGHNYCQQSTAVSSSTNTGSVACVRLTNDPEGTCIPFCENDEDCPNGTLCARPQAPIIFQHRYVREPKSSLKAADLCKCVDTAFTYLVKSQWPKSGRPLLPTDATY